MARLIPSMKPSDIANGGERLVAEALVQGLDSDVLVYHSFPWLRREEQFGRQPLRPGEADFVVIDPKLGLLVLEVKGGNLRYQPSDCRYEREYHNGKIEEIQDPFEQAMKSVFAIRDLLLKHPHFKGSKSLPFTFGSAVVFPHCLFKGTLPANVAPEILIDANGLETIRPRVRKALEAWNGGAIRREMTDSDVAAVQETLQPVFQITPALWRTLEVQESKLQRLTRDQEALLDFLGTRRKAAIDGVAGSGKTILAMSQAQRFAREGLKTLLLCYNRPLADWLKQELPETYAKQIGIHTFHSLCSDWCRNAGLSFAGHGDLFWDYEAPVLLEQAAAILPPEQKFQALVVDEGQDFRPLWWDSLERIFQDFDSASYYVFYDPKQNIYVEKPSVPGCLGDPFILPTNCRNTRAIAEHCAGILNIEIPVRDEAPVGVNPHVVTAANRTQMMRLTEKQVLEWCMPGHGGMSPSQVAILTPSEPDDLTPPWPSDFKGIKLTKGFQHWRHGKGVLLESWRRFKGLEADALVIAGVDDRVGEHGTGAADYYVASSRAKHLLTIIKIGMQGGAST
jgi:hypothetical protein